MSKRVAGNTYSTMTLVQMTRQHSSVRKMRKYLWFSSPIHVFSHGQWWSYLRTHRPQSSQWRDLNGCYKIFICSGYLKTKYNVKMNGENYIVDNFKPTLISQNPQWRSCTPAIMELFSEQLFWLESTSDSSSLSSCYKYIIANWIRF